MIILPQQQLFHPPAEPDVGASCSDHVLLTATFFAARPPALSYLCVHFPDAAFASEPRVVASQGNLILLGTGTRSFSDPYGQETVYDYFVYRAGGGSPSLDLLPAKGRHQIWRSNVGLVDSAGGYAVVTLEPYHSCKRYILRVHREKAGRWRRKIVSRKLLPTASSAAAAGGREAPENEALEFTKAVALRGSTVAWADLRRAVLLLDALADDPVAHYVPLPETLSNHNSRELLDSAADPCSLRDVVERGDAITLVEMEYRCCCGVAPAGWRAVTRTQGSAGTIHVSGATEVPVSGEDTEHMDYSQIANDEMLDDHWSREANYDAEE
ncbi:hypothetical protein C2845_PM10G02050 [Panicum miliaceum]|uniref:DUF1618 domain-containing protein n=1 Tax=Panicum miliaceum TaxID=4540 RepID=A0A3L6PFM1_PANMI|nr:hypothetical protein C2845_PM10G02050 [Panicum miliaceum]